MPYREPGAAIQHMLDHAKEAIEMSKGASRPVLEADRKLNLALTRLVEIIGEAASRVDAEERARYTEIQWSQIVGMRNRLIHGYDSVDLDILWEVVSRDLPVLVENLEGNSDSK